MDILNQIKIERLAGEIGQENVPVLLEIFLNELAMYIERLSQLEGEELQDYLKEISHALKSSAASFGAEALCHYSIEVDAMAKTGAMSELADCKGQMLSLLDETEQRYKQLLTQ